MFHLWKAVPSMKSFYRNNWMDAVYFYTLVVSSMNNFRKLTVCLKTCYWQSSGYVTSTYYVRKCVTRAKYIPYAFIGIRWTELFKHLRSSFFEFANNSKSKYLCLKDKSEVTSHHRKPLWCFLKFLQSVRLKQMIPILPINQAQNLINWIYLGFIGFVCRKCFKGN